MSFRIDTIGGKVYWAAYAADVIRRANLDGSQVEDIVTEISSVRDIEIDVENDYIYWTDDKGLYRADMEGGETEILIESSIGIGLITINYNENKIYWVDKNGATTVNRANMDGSGVETVLTGDDDHMLVMMNDMIFDNKNNLLYWNDYSPGSGGYRIMCAEPDGGSVREVLAGFGPVWSSVIDPHDELIYWTTGMYREVMKANVDGTGVRTVLRLGFALGTPQKGTIALDRNADLLYWGYTTQPWGTFTRVSTTGEGYESYELDLYPVATSFAFDPFKNMVYVSLSGEIRTERSIVRAAVNGDTYPEKEILIGEDDLNSTVTGLALNFSEGTMYWTEGNPGGIRRANRDGTEIVDLVTDLEYPTDIKLDVENGKMYWCERGSGKIRRANLGGGEVEDLFTGLSAPSALAFTFENNGSPTTVIQADIPGEFTLRQNYPNPFNPETIIEYTLPELITVKLEIFDILGRRIAILVDEVQQPGIYRAMWDASKSSSGTYLYRIQAGSFTETKRMLLMK